MKTTRAPASAATSERTTGRVAKRAGADAMCAVPRRLQNCWRARLREFAPCLAQNCNGTYSQTRGNRRGSITWVCCSPAQAIHVLRRRKAATPWLRNLCLLVATADVPLAPPKRGKARFRNWGLVAAVTNITTVLASKCGVRVGTLRDKDSSWPGEFSPTRQAPAWETTQIGYSLKNLATRVLPVAVCLS